MMKCNELQQRLDDYLDGDLDTILVSMLEQHISACESCNYAVEQSKLVQSELKQIFSSQSTGIQIPSNEFISCAFEKVRAHYPEKQAGNRWTGIGVKTGFATALAAGFALWAILSTFILPGMNSGNEPTNLATSSPTSTIVSKISTLNLKIDETRVVRLAIDTLDDFDNVTLSVVLPKNVELEGHKNKRKISWDTKLAKGNNILRIPLKAIKYGQGDFIARITHNGKVKTFKLLLKSTEPDLSNIYAIELQV
ncbi:MAG: zf-HC2 domain-containing protein [Thiohalomonadales bacterium]